MWNPILPVLGAKFTVIAPDLPGIGDSSIPSGEIGMKTAAIQIHDLVRTLGITKARVVGHDIGLMVAYAYSGPVPIGGREAGGHGRVSARRFGLGTDL